ncbi:MAG: AMP-binding protein [Clostridiales bacterium]|nr:AMP-binding protein [Clostridiales bacterium]
MEKQVALIAQRLAYLRQISGRSPEEMAEITGVSTAEYLSAENGERDFSFTFLFKCANALKVDITDLVTGEEAKLSGFSITRRGEGLPIIRRAGFMYNHLASNFKHRTAEPFVVTAPFDPGAQNAEIPTATHNGEEFDYVISGTLKVRIGDKINYLHAGDSIYYDSNTPHGMIATGGSDCVFIAVVLPPAGEKSEYKPPVQKPASAAVLRKKDDVLRIWERFIDVVENETGDLEKISFKHPDNFNFAFDVLDELAKTYPDKPAMQYVDKDMNPRTFTYAEISRYSSMTANYLMSLGIKAGDKVMLVLKRHYQFWFALCALHKIGAVAVPATNLLVKKDFEYRFNSAQISAVLCTADGDVAHQVELAEPASPTLKTKVLVGGEKEGWHGFDNEIERFDSTFPRSRCGAKSCKDVMLMFFSSGTTGYPKIVAHSFEYPLGHFITAKYWHNVDPDGLHFTISDTGWGKALWGKIYGQWLCETAVFTYDFDRFNAHDILGMFKKYNITTFCAPPTMYRFFIKEDLSKYDLSSLKHATVAGEALNPEVFNQFYSATGLKIMEGFGQTETTLAVCNQRGSEPKPGSMGKPSPLYDVDIITPEGESTKVGEVGEIVIRTDKGTPCGLFLEYYGTPDKTNEAWNNGIYHTGDTAWKDEDGYFCYVGRVDDLIKSSGYRIGPFEIESVIMELPYVLECAVTGVPDEIRGNIVKASVVLTKGTRPTEELKAEIQNYVKTHTAPYKYPRIVEFLPELPKTISGKIRRVELRSKG